MNTEISFDWNPDHAQAVIAIFLLTVGFVTFWFLSESTKIHHRIKRTWTEPLSSVAQVVYQKFVGVIFLGIIPFLVALAFFPYNVTDYGLGFENTPTSLIWVFGIAAIVIPLNMRAAKRPENLAYYPMMRIEKWTTKRVVINSIATLSYLFSYELLFRGILLFSCVDNLGVWPAIAINVALYSTTHLPKGPTETIGAIPFGLLMCYITLTTGTIWVAVFVHVILSLSNDYFAVYYHPKMKFIRS
ncbi:MAG: CPBP family intramembrane glutamic endopeptidase [Cyclobacteriaceae bacterium]